MPLYRDPKSDMPVTQFNMKWVEPAGLVKFDFLGLKTLTVLRKTADFIAAARHRDRSRRIPLDDEKTYEMLARGESVGVFQLESQGMRRALLDMRPDRFEDIIALVALYRPGPMANIPDLLRAQARAREAGLSSIPKLEPILTRDLRRHHLSGTGDAGRADPGRLFARRSRPSAPRHGQEDPQRDGGAARPTS